MAIYRSYTTGTEVTKGTIILDVLYKVKCRNTHCTKVHTLFIDLTQLAGKFTLDNIN